MFGEPEKWEAKDSGFDTENLFHSAINGFDSRMSLLGGGYSKGKTGGGGMQVGFGVAVATVNVGASYSHTSNNNSGKVTLADIDGDGLPDKIFQRNGKLYYQKNLCGKDNQHTFDKPVLIKGNINSFSESQSTNNSTNADVSVEIGMATAGVSYSITKDQDKTKTYLNDFNSDGLVDIARNGVVYFNHIGEDGIPVFEPWSTQTANPILGTNADLLDAFKPNYEAERDSLEDEYPLNDAVRMWRAPFDGHISINSVIKKLNADGDGIVFSIQHDNRILHSDSLKKAESKTYTNSIDVRKGNCLYFRLQSIYSGVADEVEWNPTIKYESVKIDTTRYLGRDLTIYDSRKDFIEGESSVATAYKSGHFTIEAPYSKDKTSDDILLKVIRQTVKDSIVLKEILLKSDSVLSDKFTYSYDALESDSTVFSFLMETQAPLDWHKVSWTPVCKYDSEDKVQRIVPHRTMFNKPILIRKPEAFPEKITNNITKIIEYTVGEGEEKENKKDTVKVYKDGFYISTAMRVKRTDRKNDRDTAVVNILVNNEEGALVYKRKWRLEVRDTLKAGTTFVNDSILAEKLATGKHNVTFTIQNELESADSVAKISITRDSIIYKIKDGNVVETSTKRIKLGSIKASVFSGYNSADLGLLYNGWGQFAYNGNKEYGEKPIDVLVLKVDKDKYNSIADKVKNGSAEDVKDDFEPINKQRFHVMGYDTDRSAYISVTDRTFISPDTVSSSRIGENEIVVDTLDVADGDGVLLAPVLLSESKGNGYSVSGELGMAKRKLSIGVSGSYSSSTSYTKVSVMDVNGDGYPDWLRDNDGNVLVQATKPTGAIGEESITTSVPLQKTESESATIGASVSFVTKEKDADAKDAISISICVPKGSSEQGKNAANGNKTSACSVSASGNFSFGKSCNENVWSDFNGDGLPDMLTGNTIRYNLGNSFEEEQKNYVSSTETSRFRTWGAGMGTKINVLGPADISFGANGTKTTSYTESMFLDVNGDGLPDRLTKDDGKINVEINTGSGFASDFTDYGSLGGSLAKSISTYGNFAVTLKIHLFMLKFNLTPSIKLSTSSGVSTVEAAFHDMDGDGLPDMVEADNGSDNIIPGINVGMNENVIYVRRNLTGRTNMLKAVTLPFGGRITIGYEQTTPSYDHPGRKWVMSSVETTGGYEENGATSGKNTFEYSGEYRDRHERDFFGFRTVRTNQLDTEHDNRLFRYSVQTYGNNRDYYTHDLVTAEALYDEVGS